MILCTFRYCTDPIVDKYAKIAAALPRKTIRDVALRLKWLMAVSIDDLLALPVKYANSCFLY